MPKPGEGRNWLQRKQSGGYYDRIDGHGCETEKPIAERNAPAYVHERNAQRRAETALAAGQLPVPGKGSEGYSAAKGKGKGKGQKRPHDHGSGTASTWWTANTATTEETKDDSSWLFPVLCIFLLGALFGGAVGYLLGYIRHYKVIILPRPPRQQPPPAIQPAAPRNRMPQVRVPEHILVTRTGGSFNHVSGCSSTTRGEEAHTNRKLDKCGLCYPAFREE